MYLWLWTRNYTVHFLMRCQNQKKPIKTLQKCILSRPNSTKLRWSSLIAYLSFWFGKFQVWFKITMIITHCIPFILVRKVSGLIQNYDDHHSLHTFYFGSESFRFDSDNEIIKRTICCPKDTRPFDESLIWKISNF